MLIETEDNKLSNILDKIEYVQYELHETFPNPIQIVRGRENNFRLGGQAWGTFFIKVSIHFVDGTVGKGEYPLELENQQMHLIPLEDEDLG